MAKSGGGIREYASRKGFTIRRVPAGSKLGEKYKYNIRGGRSSMYANSLKSARKMINFALRNR
jgi:CRISPR/Cas system CSM-associated protein Csm3 (group 7 of RAMP superfamily)